jgi:hypothetical protein
MRYDEAQDRINKMKRGASTQVADVLTPEQLTAAVRTEADLHASADTPPEELGGRLPSARVPSATVVSTGNPDVDEKWRRIELAKERGRINERDRQAALATIKQANERARVSNETERKIAEGLNIGTGGITAWQASAGHKMVTGPTLDQLKGGTGGSSDNRANPSMIESGPHEGSTPYFDIQRFPFIQGSAGYPEHWAKEPIPQGDIDALKSVYEMALKRLETDPTPENRALFNDARQRVMGAAHVNRAKIYHEEILPQHGLEVGTHVEPVNPDQVPDLYQYGIKVPERGQFYRVKPGRYTTDQTGRSGAGINRGRYEPQESRKDKQRREQVARLERKAARLRGQVAELESGE